MTKDEALASVSVRALGAVMHVSMERPEARNALSSDLKVGLVDALNAFEESSAARVMVLSGCDCGAFSAGGDLARVRGRLEDGLPIHDPAVPDLFAVLDRRTKPVIAAIDGYALGGGMELAIACDIRIASARSSFGMPEPRAGMVGEYGLDRLSRVMPLGEAMRLQLTGATIDASRAYQIGFVQELVEDRSALFAAADRVAGQILQCAPASVTAIRKVILAGQDLGLREAVRNSAPVRAERHASADALEGVRAFAEKRRPRWVDDEG